MSFLFVDIKGADGTLELSRKVNEKHFSTGSDGYHASFKMDDPNKPGARLQVNLQFVEIGSKDKNNGE